jgi:hypothetical protein
MGTQASLGAALAAAFRYRGHQCTLQLAKRINTSSSSPDYRCSAIAPRTRVAEAYAMVFLVGVGLGQQTDVAWAFAVSVRTIRRYQERYADVGMAALGREEGWRRGRRRISGKRVQHRNFEEPGGRANLRSRRLGVTENAIRKLVGPSKPESKQLALPAIATAAKEPATVTQAITPLIANSGQCDGAVLRHHHLG